MTTKKKPGVGAIKTPAAPKAQESENPASPRPKTPAEQQLAAWEAGVKLFAQRQFAEASGSFTTAAKGPASHIADKARSYLQVCERRTAAPPMDFRTAEDHFNYGVERLNARDFAQARDQFTQALSMEPEGDHIFYTLALCCGLSGDGSGACENLKRAIDLEPRNRILARQDPEFSALATQISDLRAVLNPGGGS